MFIKAYQFEDLTLSVICFSVMFNFCNAYFNGVCLFQLCQPSPLDIPRVTVGLALFAVGMNINKQADRTLTELKAAAIKSGEKYRIPTRGLFEYVTAPNYFGELIEWTGFWIIAWSISTVPLLLTLF